MFWEAGGGEWSGYAIYLQAKLAGSFLPRFRPMAMAASGTTTAASRKAVADAARGALLAVHAAAGLAAVSGARDATRLLRVAEGMTRAAVALLVAPPSPTPASPEVATGDMPQRKRRPRGKRGVQENAVAKEAVDSGGVSTAEKSTAPVAAVRPAAPGGGVDSYMDGCELAELHRLASKVEDSAVALGGGTSSSASSCAPGAGAGIGSSVVVRPAAAATAQLLRERAAEHGPEAAALLAQIEKAMFATTRPPT